MKCKCLESNSLWYVQVWRTHARLLLLRSLAMIWEQPTVLTTWSGRLVFCLFVGLYVPPTSRHFSCCFHSHIQKLSGPTKSNAQRNLTKTQFWFLGRLFSGSENMTKKHARFFPDLWKKTSRNDLFLHGFNHQKTPSKFTKLCVFKKLWSSFFWFKTRP